MSAEILRRAARQMREDVAVIADGTGSMPDSFPLAVADLLDVAAKEADDLDEFDGFDPHVAIPGYSETVAVARTYLGES